MKVKLLIICVLVGFSFSLKAQYDPKADTSLNIPIIHASYGIGVPEADLAKRFGLNSELTFGFWYKTTKNLIWGFDASFLWGSNIREDSTILNHLKNSNGAIIGDDGQYVLYRLYERGYKFPVVKIGKLFPFKLKGTSANAGFFFLMGVGFMQHKIKIDDQSRTFVHIREEYYKGYDRLTNGILLTQNIGYMYFDKNKKINFFAHIELAEGFTKNRRSYNFDQKVADTKNRIDLLYSFKVGLAIPIYKKTATDFYYN